MAALVNTTLYPGQDKYREGDGEQQLAHGWTLGSDEASQLHQHAPWLKRKINEHQQARRLHIAPCLLTLSVTSLASLD